MPGMLDSNFLIHFSRYYNGMYILCNILSVNSGYKRGFNSPANNGYKRGFNLPVSNGYKRGYLTPFRYTTATANRMIIDGQPCTCFFLDFQ
jgi:hypothetical protein